jgi:hypothetical protein
MQKILLLLCCVLCCSFKAPVVQIKYFDTPHKKQKSTVVTLLTGNIKSGHAIAYNREGREIYRKEISRLHGHATVRFEYYDNGAVKRAHYSTAPDGGIQWYRNTTYFSEDGVVTRVEEQSHDDSPVKLLRRKY